MSNEKEKKELITVHSSHGTLTVEGGGLVIDKQVDCEFFCENCIEDIKSFDLAEFRRFYGCSQTDYDILDLAGTYHDGTTFEAEPEFRKDVLKTLYDADGFIAPEVPVSDRELHTYVTQRGMLLRFGNEFNILVVMSRDLCFQYAAFRGDEKGLFHLVVKDNSMLEGLRNE